MYIPIYSVQMILYVIYVTTHIGYVYIYNMYTQLHTYKTWSA